ncbi:DUF397 domain-containing protein [Actinomadura verrucosospora]|uniref:DUF397 domain-containing protein n=1 Tax=Actinomadura verrucosospora TaxID=46165 RepID=UPI0015656E3A|nr:DUF397 domain-containing protein [Actinomadura verrucosospora]
MTIHWRKSSYSGTATDDVCVELGRLAPGADIGVRDSKAPKDGHLTLTSAQFIDLIARIKQDA